MRDSHNNTLNKFIHNSINTTKSRLNHGTPEEVAMISASMDNKVKKIGLEIRAEDYANKKMEIVHTRNQS